MPLFFLALYTMTLMPGVGWGDEAKYQVEALTLDWPREAGLHGLYAIVSALFVQAWPWGSVAYKANLFSAVCAAAALAVFIRVLRTLGISQRSTALATLTLGLSHTFWTHATWAESYPLFACLWIGAVGVGMRYLMEGHPRDLALTLGLFGLTLWVNLMATQGLAAFLCCAVLLRPECRKLPAWKIPLLALLVGLSPWLGRLLWALGVEKIPLDLVLMRAFELDFAHQLWIRHSPSDWIRGARAFPLYFLYQFGLMAFYFTRLRRLPARVWLFPVLLTLLIMLFCSTFLPQRTVWVLMAAWLPLFLLMATCLDVSMPATPRMFILPLLTVAGYALLSYSVQIFLDQHPAARSFSIFHAEPVGTRNAAAIFLKPWKQDERSAQDYIDEVESTLKAKDMIVCDFTPAATLRYAKEVEGRLHNITIAYLRDDLNSVLSSAPPGTGLWLGRDSAEFHRRLDGMRWRTEKVGSLLRVEKRP